MAEFFGIEVTTKSGKTNWQSIRRVGYCLLITWVIGLRMMGMDPFDDFNPGKGVGLWTLFDALGLVAVYLLAYHIIWSARPKVA